MALISVPIGGSSGGYRSSAFSSGYGHSHLMPRGGSGPPYIVKVTNLPLTADNSFIEDLFKLRYTPVAKTKVVFDPHSNPLTLGIVRKVAFVELTGDSDYQKVQKWFDAYYRPGKRVNIDAADFHDFQSTMAFNSDHQQELDQLEKEGPKLAPAREPAPPRDRPNPFGNAKPVPMPALSKPSPTPAGPKPNPFGNAKPVDTAAKEQEIEKKVITLNGTTTITVGDDQDREAVLKQLHKPKLRRASSTQWERRPSVLILRREDAPPSKEQLPPAQRAAPPPPPLVYALGKSLAEVLAKKPEANGHDDAKRNAKKLKPPTVLKKKTPSQEPQPEPVAPESDGGHDGHDEPRDEEPAPVAEPAVDQQQEATPVAAEATTEAVVPPLEGEDRPDFKAELNNIMRQQSRERSKKRGGRKDKDDKERKPREREARKRGGRDQKEPKEKEGRRDKKEPRERDTREAREP